MKFPRLLCFVTLFLFLQLTLVNAQVDNISFDFSQINIGENYHLLSYNLANNELTEVVKTPNYASSKQHIVTSKNCGNFALANSFEIISSNPSGIVCDNQQQTTFTVSSSLINYEYQFYINGISIQGPSTSTLLTYAISSSSTITVIASLPAASNLCSETQRIFHEYYELQASSLNSFSFTHIGIQLGTSVENFDFGFQHAIPLRVVNQVNPPSVFELYVAFDFSPYRRNNRGLFKRLQSDNY